MIALNHNLRILLLIFLIGVCANSCSTSPETTSTATKAIVKDTQTESPSETEIIHTPSAIIYPTLSLKDSKEQITALINNNGNCQLPCWWGIIPGESFWTDVEPYLKTLADDIVLVNGQILHKYGEKIPVDVYIFIKKLDDYSENVRVAFAVNPEGLIEEIAANEPLTQVNFTISQLLNEYGKPEDVKINLTTEFAEGGVYYWIALLYPEEGFGAFFKGEGEEMENKMRVCPEETGPYLIMVSPEGLTLNLMIQIIDQNGWGGSSNLPSIDEFPDLSIESFTESMEYPSGCVYFPLE